jgi:hypothetical protein
MQQRTLRARAPHLTAHTRYFDARRNFFNQKKRKNTELVALFSCFFTGWRHKKTTTPHRFTAFHQIKAG